MPSVQAVRTSPHEGAGPVRLYAGSAQKRAPREGPCSLAEDRGWWHFTLKNCRTPRGHCRKGRETRIGSLSWCNCMPMTLWMTA